MRAAPDPTGLYFGAVMAAYPLAKAPIVPLVGHVSDRFGHRAVLTSALLFLGLTFILTTCVNGYNGLMGCRLLTGLAGANGALLHAWIPKLASPADHILFFADLSLAWNLAAVITKYAVPVFGESLEVCFAVGAGCLVLSAGLVLLTFWFASDSGVIVSDKVADAESAALVKAPHGGRPWTALPPHGNLRPPSLDADATTSTNRPGDLRTDEAGTLYSSLLAFLSDRVVCAIILCEFLTPRFNYFLATTDKGATASVVADIQGNAALLALAAQTFGFNTLIYRSVDKKACAVVGLVLKAVPVLLMTSASLATFHSLALFYALACSVVEPACRTVLQSRASRTNHGHSVGAWVGWLHTARALSQLISTMTSSYLANSTQLLYCPSVAIMLVVTAVAYSSVPYPPSTESARSKEA